MSEQAEPRRPMGKILADIDALPLSRDPFRQMAEVESLNRLLAEAEWDGGPGSRDDELRRHPEAARVLLGLLDRMLPIFDDAEIRWAEQHHTRHLFPKDYYQVADPFFTFLPGEYLPGLPGYADARSSWSGGIRKPGASRRWSSGGGRTQAAAWAGLTSMACSNNSGRSSGQKVSAGLPPSGRNCRGWGNAFPVGIPSRSLVGLPPHHPLQQTGAAWRRFEMCRPFGGPGC